MRAGILLLALLSSALAGPFGGGGGAPFGSSTPGPATTAVAGLTKVRPIVIDMFSSPSTGGATATNVPAATTEWLGSIRFRKFVDLTNFTECRLEVAENAGAPSANTHIGIQYSLDSGSTWFFMDDSADGDLGSETPQITMGANAYMRSNWMTLGTAARGDVMLRILTDDGDGAADPTFNRIDIHFR